MTLEELKQAKKETGCSYRQLSDLSGIPLSTVQKIFDGTTRAPRYRTLQALTNAFAKLNFHDPSGTLPRADQRPLPETGPDVFISDRPYPGFIKETPAAWGLKEKKKPGEYTIEDVFALPDDVRVELIDGVLYDMANPLIVHQGMLGELYLAFHDCIEKHKSSCRVYLAPCGVQLDQDNRTLVEPDLLVLCGDDKLRRRVIYGAPDLVVEILSPSTRRKDMYLKLSKYEHAGVREYWMVDIENRRVIVNVFGDTVSPSIYPFDSKVPISISEGDCEIDFKQIWDHLGYLQSLE